MTPEIFSLKNKKVTVIGAGKSGIEAAKLAASKGAIVTLNDIKQKNIELPENIQTFYGSHPEQLLLSSDIIIISPGVPPFETLKKAETAGIPVIGEIELALRFISGKICAVTGTNGKSTTVSLLGEIMQETGKSSFAGGNLGKPLAQAVNEGLNPEYSALELSSFQLETVSSLKPAVAALLNLTEDHLDRYDSFDHYCRTKLKIFNGLDQNSYGLINADDPKITEITANTNKKLLGFSISGKPVPFRYENNNLVFSDFNLKIPVSEINLVGMHMYANVLAASASALLAGISPLHIINAIRKYKGLPHRMEFSGEKNGIKFYNDSKATNVGSVAGSMAGFTGNYVLIMGGRHKGASYKPLKSILQKGCKAITVIGESSELIIEDLGDTFEIIRAKTMDEAILKSFEKAKEGDSVVLSPACSSYDMFENYKVRGKAFADAVRKL